MCNKAICGDPLSLQFVPDWFVRSKLLEMWHNDFGLNVDDEVDECYGGYKKTKGQGSRNKRTAKIRCLASIKMVGSGYARG